VQALLDCKKMCWEWEKQDAQGKSEA
jgi:hypothetical protein